MRIHFYTLRHAPLETSQPITFVSRGAAYRLTPSIAVGAIVEHVVLTVGEMDGMDPVNTCDSDL